MNSVVKNLQYTIFQYYVFDVRWSVRLGINLVPKQVIKKSCYTVLHMLYTLVIFQWQKCLHLSCLWNTSTNWWHHCHKQWVQVWCAPYWLQHFAAAVRTLHGFGGLLPLPELAPDDLSVCFVNHDSKAHLTF